MLMQAEDRPVSLVLIRNPFEPWDRELKTADTGQTVGRYVQEFFPFAPPEFELVLVVNGRICTDTSEVLGAGDSLAIVPVPGKGGGGGKNVVQVVGMVAMMVVAWYAAPVLAASLLGNAAYYTAGTMAFGVSTLGTITTGVISAAITTVGGALLGGLSSASDVSADYGGGGSEISSTPTYSWNQQPNTTSDASACPVLHGTHLIQPPVIGRYISTDGDKQYLNLLLLVADHAVDSITGVLINDQPVEFFSSVELDYRYGTLDQTVIENFGDTYTDTSVGYLLSTDWRQAECPGNTAQGLGIGLSLPRGLYYANNSGGLDSQSVEVEIQYRAVGDVDWIVWGTETITGSSNTALYRFYRIDDLDADQYEIRMRFTSAPPTSPRYGNTVRWEYLQEIVYDDFTYPGASLLSVKAMATDEISGGMPTIKCLATRSTVEVWNPDTEEYDSESASNPAWCCYDWLHNDIYGGGIAAEYIDYERFREWADWCDTEGYTVNLFTEAFTSLNKILSTVATLGRGAIVQAGSSFSCIVERPEPLPVQRFMFNVANVVRDSFEIAYLDFDERANAAEITYFDADLDYSRQVVYLQDDTFDTTEMEVNKKALTLLGCTSRAMAIKHGRWLLNNNRYLTTTATWTAGVDSIACQPGDVVDVQHDVPQWGFGGRVVSATENTVTLDKEVTLSPGTSYALQVKLADDRRDDVPVASVLVETTTDTLTITEPWLYDAPEEFDLWQFGPINAVSKPMRIVKITRKDDQTRRITALEYVEEVYDDDADIPAPESVSSLRTVSGLTAQEIWTLGSDGSGQSVIGMSWRGSGTLWNVFLKELGGAWEKVGTTPLPRYTVTSPLVVGHTYSVGVSVGDSVDNGEAVSLVIAGKEGAPSDVENFALAQVGNQVVGTWDHIPDADLWGYEIREGASWDSGTVVVDGVQENRATYNPPADGTYGLWLKAIDESENYSENAAFASITVDIEGGLNIVRDQDEFDLSPVLDGSTVTNLTYNSGTDALDFDGDPGEISYVSQEYDLGRIGPTTLRMYNAFDATLVGVTDEQISARTDQTYPQDTDTDITSPARILQYYRSSTDGATWTEWALYSQAATMSLRYYQLKWVVTIDDLYEFTTLSISSLRHIADVPELETVARDQSVSNSGTTFTLSSFDIDISVGYVVGVTVQGSAARLVTVDKGSSSFTVYLFDTSGTGVSGTVDLTIRGY